MTSQHGTLPRRPRNWAQWLRLLILTPLGVNRSLINGLALIDDTQAVTVQLKKAIGSINDSGKKQAALKWVRSGSRIMLRSLNAGLKAKDAARKENEAATARQKLDEVRKLLE